jgi:uncharacterized membrane protein
MDREPAALISTITAFLTAGIGLALAFGLKISQEQQDAMLKMLAATVALLLMIGPVIRQFVYSPHSTQTLVNTAEQAGQTNSPAPPVVP